MDYSDQKLLLELIQSGKIELDVLEEIRHMKKDKVMKIHGYSITKPKSKNGRWQTFIREDDKGRVKLTAKSEKVLIEKLYDIYFGRKIKNLEDFYPDWVTKRIQENVSDYTIRKNENHWKKYYLGETITSVDLEMITAEMVEDFFYKQIRKYDMTVKDLMNVKFIMSNMMRLAKRRNLIERNPFDEVSIKTYSCIPPSKKSENKKIFLDSEKNRLFAAMNQDLYENPHITDAYAIFLLFKLGLRIGEVAALKKDDIDYDHLEIHIHRMETKKMDENHKLRPVVVDYVKKKSVYGDRYLPLSDYEIGLFREIERINKHYGYKDQDFIFIDENGRTGTGEIDYRIRKYCRQAGIKVKSVHDIRRTVASELYAKRVPIEYIQEYLGHSTIQTTRSYIYDLRSRQERSSKIIESLKDMNGLTLTQKDNNKKMLRVL